MSGIFRACVSSASICGVKGEGESERERRKRSLLLFVGGIKSLKQKVCRWFLFCFLFSFFACVNFVVLLVGLIFVRM